MQLDKPLFGDGGEQVRLVGEVPVGGSRADARAPRRLSQGEAFRSTLGHQRERRAGQRPFEVAVVIAVAAGRRGTGRLLLSHVDDINITRYVKAIHIAWKGEHVDSTEKGTGWAVVTGASSGFGAIFADQLAKRGLSLLLAGRDERRFSAVAQQVRDTVPGVQIDIEVAISARPRVSTRSPPVSTAASSRCW